jgi:signal transduction histidine kinase
MDLISEQIRLLEVITDPDIDGVIVYDRHLKVIFLNKAAERLCDFEKENGLDCYFENIFPYHKHNSSLREGITEAFSGTRVRIACEIVALKHRYQEYNFVPLKNESGEISHLLHLIHDIGYRVHAERELRALNKSLVRKNRELERKNADIGSFSNMISQGLDLPMHKIYSMVELIMQREAEDLSEQVKQFLKRIQGSAHRLKLLANDLHQYTELSRRKLKLRETDLNLLIKKLKYSFGDERSSQDYIVIPEKLPVVKVDGNSMGEVFRQLLSNSIKFQSERTPEVIISAEKVNGTIAGLNENRNYWKIIFEDNGIGFEQDGSEKLFAIFSQMHGNKYPGSGLGLSVCRRILEMHDGWIKGEGEVGKGAKFSLFIPADDIK